MVDDFRGEFADCLSEVEKVSTLADAKVYIQRSKALIRRVDTEVESLKQLYPDCYARDFATHEHGCLLLNVKKEELVVLVRFLAKTWKLYQEIQKEFPKKKTEFDEGVFRKLKLFLERIDLHRLSARNHPAVSIASVLGCKEMIYKFFLEMEGEIDGFYVMSASAAKAKDGVSGAYYMVDEASVKK